MELKDLQGKHLFQGIELDSSANFIKFTLDGVTYRLDKDGADGWRSYCGELYTVDIPCYTKLPDIEVICKHLTGGAGYPHCNILEFIDANNGKTVLMVGTNNTQNYYPFCVFEYTPENFAINSPEISPRDALVRMLADDLYDSVVWMSSASIDYRATAENLVRLGYLRGI